MGLVSISLLPPEFRQWTTIRQKQRKWLLGFFIVSFVLLAALATVAINVKLAQRQMESLLGYRQMLDSRLQDMVAYEETVNQLSQLSDIKEKITSGAVAWSDLLVELGRSTPEGVWLTDFRGTAASGGDGNPQGEVVLRGEASDHLLVSRYLKKLRAMKHLSGVRCSFSLGSGTGRVHFEITALVSGLTRDLM